MIHNDQKSHFFKKTRILNAFWGEIKPSFITNKFRRLSNVHKQQKANIPLQTVAFEAESKIFIKKEIKSEIKQEPSEYPELYSTDKIDTFEYISNDDLSHEMNLATEQNNKKIKIDFVNLLEER